MASSETYLAVRPKLVIPAVVFSVTYKEEEGSDSIAMTWQRAIVSKSCSVKFFESQLSLPLWNILIAVVTLHSFNQGRTIYYLGKTQSKSQLQVPGPGAR